MSTKISIFILIQLLLYVFQFSSCKESDNQVLNYFNNAELQYEADTQRENLITAMKDVLNLTEDQLKNKKYKDYSGKDNQWNLKTLIYKHFVPDNQSKTLGDDFYHDIKAKEVQDNIRQILKQLEM